MEMEAYKPYKIRFLLLGIFIMLLYVSLLVWRDAEANFGILEYLIIALSAILIFAAILLKASLQSVNQLLFISALVFILTYFRNYNWTVFFWMGYICNQYAKLNYNRSLKDVFWKIEEWYNRKTN